MEIKFFNKEDLKTRVRDFCELSHICFSAPVDEKIIIQRYIENPYQDLLMCIAEERGKIVANYSAVPIRCQIGNKEIKAALSLNTMTHPEYEGKGLFVELASRLYSKMESEQYSFIIGFPNYLSNGIFCKKLDWKNIYEIPTMEKELDGNRKKMIERNAANRKEDWTRLCLHLPNQIHISKKYEYLKWRYIDHPTNQYYLLKISDNCWSIYHFYNKEMNLTEIHANENVNENNDMLDQLTNFALLENVKKITVWCQTNTIMHGVLERRGFVNKTPIRYFGAKALAYKEEIVLFDWRNWSICMGDDNVY